MSKYIYTNKYFYNYMELVILLNPFSKEWTLNFQKTLTINYRINSLRHFTVSHSLWYKEHTLPISICWSWCKITSIQCACNNYRFLLARITDSMDIKLYFLSCLPILYKFIQPWSTKVWLALEITHPWKYLNIRACI